MRLPQNRRQTRGRRAVLRGISTLMAGLLGTLLLPVQGQVLPADPVPVASSQATDPSQAPSNAVPELTNLNPASLRDMLSNPPAPAPSNSDSPELGQLPTPGVLSTNTPAPDQARIFQSQLEHARKSRAAKDSSQAAQILTALLRTNAPVELKRPVLFELALVAQDAEQFAKAQQIFAQYLQVYKDDPSTPEVLLRQGLIYRQMGVNDLAISKFYSVMSTALKLKLDNLDYYKKLVLQAQIEIADTYYLEAKYTEAADYFTRLLKNPPPGLDQSQIEYKLIRSFSGLSNHVETIAHGQTFIEAHPDSADVPEVRFLLAAAMKSLNRNQDALKQVLLLLQSQRENSRKNPELWAYWQRKAGTEIAAELFKEGDYMDALEINLSLADLNKTPEWQLPVWYQTALVYEQLQQWPKAMEIYQNIIDRRPEVADPSPSLLSLFEMAKWRKDYLAWLEKAKTTDQLFQSSATNRPPAAPVAAQ